MTSKGSNTGRWLMGVISVALVAGIILIAIPNVFGNHRYPQYQESEAKQNLHAIQLALERYAVDSGGNYPLWISGGSYPAGNFNPADSKYMLDPLVCKAYMVKYPANPFLRSGRYSEKAVQELKELQEVLQDPLRPMEQVPLSAPSFRFGRDYNLMGNVMADLRFAEVIVGVDSDVNPVMKHTASDVIYRCWDIEELEEPHPWLQGQFFYKSTYSYEWFVEDELESRESHPAARYYILGCYGSVANKGKDILGEEQPLPWRYGSGSEMTVWSGTGVPMQGSSLPKGAPFLFRRTDDVATLQFGNPNGIADMICLVLARASDGYDGSR
ncbi:MAG: hypothetical protein R3F46_14935 [bacterium]